MNHEDVTNRENESETIDTLEYQKDIQTLKISQLMFHDENIQRELAIIQDKNRENLLEQDITFYNGYIIGILALKHFKDIEAVVFLTNQDYLNVYYEPTKNLYVIYNEKVGCVALNRDDFSHIRFYHDQIRPVYTNITELKYGLSEPLLLNACGTTIKKPDQLLRRLQTKYNINRCTSLQARKALINVRNFVVHETLRSDNNCMTSYEDTLLERQNRAIKENENISAILKHIDLFQVHSVSQAFNQDSEAPICHLGNIHLKSTKNNFETLLTLYPANIESKTPTVSQISLLLDSTSSECKRLIARWNYKQTMSRLESLPDHFRVVPTTIMIDDHLLKLGWNLKMKKSYYDKIMAACIMNRIKSKIC